MSSMTTHPCLKRKGRHIFPLGACPHCELKRAKAEIERLEASRQKIFESADGEIERLRAELAASREREARMRWQSIETAPKDGTHVLIYVPEASGQKVMEAYWVTPWESAPAEQCWWSTPYGPTGRGYMVLPEEVKNWHPMPDPPSAALAEGAQG